MQKSIILIIITVFSFISCNKQVEEIKPTSSYNNIDELVEDSKKNITEISAQDLKALMDNAESYILIDVRESDEHNSEFIPGSISIPRGVLEFRINNEQVWDKEGMYPPLKEDLIILYCKKGHRGTLSVESLIKLGYTNVKNVTGGWLEWKTNFPDVFDVNESAGGAPTIASGGESGGC